MYKEPQALTDVAKFMKAFTQPVLEVPTIPSEDRCELRVKLIQEELNELSDAIKAKDIVECADAFADLQYVLSGAIHEFGLGERFCNIFDNVHQSNMSKICTSYEEAADTLKHYKNQGIEVYSEKLEGDTYVIKRKEDNKVLKSINYTPAKLLTLVKGEYASAEPIAPFMQRLLFEADEVKGRIKGLEKFVSIGMPSVDELQKILLPIQLQAMKSYLAVLSTRIKIIQGI
jgi:predicted HAD superfamily Cof-like phosphohydrolase